MLSLGGALQAAIILFGLIHGYQAQVCNKTVSFRQADGSIQSQVQSVCCKGYVKAVRRTDKKPYCKAKCSKRCVNGDCSAPNVCTCKEGYEFESEFNQNICVAKCDNCTNGTCVKPNVCQCRAKFHKNEEGVCVPNCDPACVQGVCTDLNTCRCNKGYQHSAESQHICEPACEKPCVNGFCSAVNKCTCWEGFSREIDDPSRCSKRRECRNGVEDKEGNCLCNEDQKIIESEKNATLIFECVDKVSPCDQKCIDSKCPLEETCKCPEGFMYEEVGGWFFQCLPVCDHGCVNGHCVAPNQCECEKGFYSKDGQKHHCHPVCEMNCTNGFCSAPNVCSCNDGYGPDFGSECHPLCSMCTENQECIAPEECECKKNFKPTEDGDCKEIICNLGLISADGECLCLEGYFLDETSTCREVIAVTTEVINPQEESQEEEEEEEEEINNDLFAYKEAEEEHFSITESDMEIIPTTVPSLCINGRVLNGKCICSEDAIQLMDNECVSKTTIEYQVPENLPKISCSERCVSGLCHANGTCKCPSLFKLSPEDETECVPLTDCEICFSADLHPCPSHCFSIEYSPSSGNSRLTQYLIIFVACVITVALLIIALVVYRRMQKHDYYTGPVVHSPPIYAYEMETLT